MPHPDRAAIEAQIRATFAGVKLGNSIYYLPALMLSLLSNYDPGSMRVIGTIAALYPKSTGNLARSYAYLTDDQHRGLEVCCAGAAQLLGAVCGRVGTQTI